jgi:integrase
MATLKTRPRKSGMRYIVEFRIGGARDGEWATETFKDEKLALKFKADVEFHGHRYPTDYVRKFGYVDPQVLAEEKARLAREAAEAAAAKPIYFREHYLAFLKTLSTIEERTERDYEQQFANHLLPVFGGLAVNDGADVPDDQRWDADKVKAWVKDTHRGVRDPATNGWLKEPRSAKTVRNLHALLSSYGKWLVEKKLRAANPCATTSLPESEEGLADGEMIFLEAYEYAQLRDCIKEQEARDLVEFLVGTGVRYGEATALKIKDVKLDTRDGLPYLLIRQAWKRQRNGSHKEGRPKSKASRRRVDLASNHTIIAMLRRLLAGRGNEEFVFLTPTGVHWRHANFYNRPWLQAVWKAARCDRHRAEQGITNMHDLKRRHVIPCGCPGTLDKVPRIHDLRHTCASWLIERGVSLAAIQRQFGHESYHTTEKRYVHLTSGTRHTLGAAADDVLSTVAGLSLGGAAASLVERHRPASKQIRRHRMFGVRGADPLRRAAG